MNVNGIKKVYTCCSILKLRRDDTDTVGAVAGGLAGIYYGMEAIPEEWINLLAKKEWIISLVEQMIERKKEFYFRNSVNLYIKTN